MNAMPKRVHFLLILLFFLGFAITPANVTACSDVDEIFGGVSRVWNQFGDLKKITIRSIFYEEVETFSGYVIDGPIKFDYYEAPCGGYHACDGLTGVSPHIANWWNGFWCKIRPYSGPVLKIKISFSWLNRGCIPEFENYVAVDCEYTYSPYNTGPLTIYTPLDNPHPIVDYLLNRYKAGACIQPFEVKEPPPDEDKAPEPAEHGEDPELEKPEGDPGKQGEPISIYSGNNIHLAKDLSLPSPFYGGLVVKRWYNSRFREDDIQDFDDWQLKALKAHGYGWSNNYSSVLRKMGFWTTESATMPDGYECPFLGQYYTYTYISIRDETGRQVFFKACGLDRDGAVYHGRFGEDTYVERVGSQYIWHRADGRLFVYNINGMLVRIDDRHGNRQSLAYGSDSRLASVTDEASGRVLTFHYNARGLLERIEGPVTEAVADGVWVRYGYDENDNLTSVTYADGSGRIYEYNDPNDVHNLTVERDKEGNFIYGWAYDDQDRAVANTTNDGRQVHINYVDDNTVEVTNAYDVIHTYHMMLINGRKRIVSIESPPDCPGCGQAVSAYTYDTAGRVVQIEYVNGRVDRYLDYDERGNPRTLILDFGGPGQTTLHYQYHPYLDEPLRRSQASVLGAGDKETIWDYDDDGNDIANETPTSLVHRVIERGFTLDEAGNVVPYEYVTVYEYNEAGQVVSIDGPRPGDMDRITMTYDPGSGDLLSTELPLTGQTIWSEYDAAGNPGKMIDPNGIETLFEYDGRNRVVSTTRAGVTYFRTFYGRRGKPEYVIDGAGRRMDFAYSAEGHLERVVDPGGNYRLFVHNARGDVTEEAIYSATGQRRYWVRYDYGDYQQALGYYPGKPWKVIYRKADDSGDIESVYGYDAMGNVVSFTDGVGSTVTYLYDAFNRLECEQRPGEAITEYGYDLHGNLISVKDPGGQLTRYVYDDMGRLVEVESPDTGILRNMYDEAGNLVRQEKNGRVKSLSYDGQNRLVSVSYDDGTAGVFYSYDRGDGANVAGRLASVSDGSGQRYYSYDVFGNLSYEQRVVGGVFYETEYEFDAAGNLRSIVYPGGEKVEYESDSVDAGHVSRVVLNDSEVIASGIRYEPFGPLSGLIYGNGLQLEKFFDKGYRPVSIHCGNIQALSYRVDGAGRVIEITNNLDDSRSQSFGYDTLGRLTSATGVYGSIEYTYDKSGNRLSRIVNGRQERYTYFEGTNKVSMIEGPATVLFDYDASGNTISRTFASGQPAAGRSDGDYVYSFDGQRAVKTVGQAVTVYHYDYRGRLIGETTAEGVPVCAYVYLQGQPLAKLEADDGWFTATGPPQGWGYFSSGAKYAYETIKDFLSKSDPTPCGGR